MRITIIAVGRLRRGPEVELCADYVSRATAAGRQAKLGPVRITEVEAKSASRADSSAILSKALPAAAAVVVLDERGENTASTEFADRIARWRDEGRAELVLCIGGADGVDPAFRKRADFLLAFGAQTWPHKLVRVMACEQVYRAISLLTNGPYHRG